MGAAKRKASAEDELGNSAACAGGKSQSAGGTDRRAGARKMRLERIRKEIKNGTYETEGKLRIAISRLIDNVLTRGARKKGTDN